MIQEKAIMVLRQAQEVASQVETWADFSNALFDQKDGIVAKVFPDSIDRQAFFDTPEYHKIYDILGDLMKKYGIVNGGTPKKSGKFVVRIPKTLHEGLEIEAKSEGVSLNQLAAHKLSLPLKGRMQKGY